MAEMGPGARPGSSPEVTTQKMAKKMAGNHHEAGSICGAKNQIQAIEMLFGMEGKPPIWWGLNELET